MAFPTPRQYAQEPPDQAGGASNWKTLTNPQPPPAVALCSLLTNPLQGLAVPFSPKFEGPIQGYAANFIAKNQWRVSRLYDRADLMQEAYIIYMRVVLRYPDIETPQHFMALFKRTWLNYFTDLANDDTRSRIMVQHTDLEDEDGFTTSPEPVGDLDQYGDLSIKLKQAPSEISMVLNLFLNAPQEILEIALGAWRGADKRCKAGGSKRICQVLGIDPSKDIMRAVEDYFRP